MPWTPMRNRSMAFVDVESTGLDPDVHEVIEYAIVRVNPAGEETLRWATKIKPSNIEAAHPKALEVNGYTEAAWADAPTMQEVGHEIADGLEDCVLVGHNVAFDEAMLKGNLKRAGIDRRIPYHKVDTVTLAYEHLVPEGLESLSLDNIRKFLGWSSEGAHTAMKDVEDAMRLYNQITSKQREMVKQFGQLRVANEAKIETIRRLTEVSEERKALIARLQDKIDRVKFILAR